MYTRRWISKEEAQEMWPYSNPYSEYAIWEQKWYEKYMKKKALKLLEERLKKNHDLKAEYLKEKQKLKLERERRQFMKGEAYYLSIQYSRRMARELDEDDRDSL